MKNTLIFLILIFLAPVRTFAQEEQGFVPEQQEESSEDLINHIGRLTETADSLRNANTVLKDMWKESQRETEEYKKHNIQLQQRVDSLIRLQTNAVSHLVASNDSLRFELVAMASNFIYIPYERYSVEKIAIPAFEFVRGSELYRKNRIFLDLLENYSSDIRMLIVFLGDTTDQVWEIPYNSIIKERARDALSQFRSLPLYHRYTAYDDWRNTYLGKCIVRIEQKLESPGTASTELTASKDELMAIRNELGALIRN